MKATAALRVERQIPQPPGQHAQVSTPEVVCPKCLGRVSVVLHTAKGEPYRDHNQRMPNGELCDYGQGETDPAGTISAF